MADKNKRQAGSWRSILVLTITFAGLTTWAGCEKQPAESTETERRSDESAESVPIPAEDANEPAQGDPTRTDTKPPASAKPTLSEIIAARKHWKPIHTSLYGKAAPDFSLTDINGKRHKLSDYRGKNVVLVFWATWCPACKLQIPHLIALRNVVGEEKLAVLGASNEQAALVKGFVSQANINYAVLLDDGKMPVPFGVLRAYRSTGLPSTFFIDPEGKMKLATAGLVSLGEMKAITEASSELGSPR